MNKMTKRQRYETILKGGRADTLLWAPNFDHWLSVNRTNGTVPEEYRNLERNDIVRATGATIWARSKVLEMTQPHVAVEKEEVPGEHIRTLYRTPVGSVDTLHRYASDLTRARFLTEHMIKSREDIRVVRYMAEDTEFSYDPGPFEECERQVGIDGISLVSLPFCMPYIQFGKTDAGWERGIYLWHDHREEVEGLIGAYAEKNAEAARILARGPSLVVQSGDNMDELTTPPNIFERYGIPYFRRIADILHEGNKLFEVHWCGRTKNLLHYVSSCGIDVVEAVTVRPMDDLTIPEALEKTGSQVVIQGGIPSILMCPQGGSREKLRNYVEDLLQNVPLGQRFILGMSDNVPPDADFPRVRMISEISGRT